MMGLGRPILTQQDLQQYVTSLATQDVIWAPLYDANSYPTAGVTQLSYFTAPLGQGTTSAPGGSGTKTLADTNLNSAGQLTKGNEFLMTGQELIYFPGVAPENYAGADSGQNGGVNDVFNVGKSGVLTLQIQNRNYLQDGPLQLFPPTARLAVSAGIGGSATAGTQSILEVAYAHWAGETYDITPVYLEATQGFSEVIQWPAAVTVNTTGRLYSRMRGYLIRNAQ
jgi:hypothetical protein